LEFRGEPSFMSLFVSGVAFFGANIVVLALLIVNYARYGDDSKPKRS
jgi:hypothetical protein